MKNLCFVLLAVLFFGFAHAQEVENGEQQTVRLNAQQFEIWIETQAKPNNLNQQVVTNLEKVILNRLQAEKFTTDDAVIAVVSAWIRFESRQPNPEVGKLPVTYSESKRVIQEIIKLLYGHPLLLARLLQKNAYLLALLEDKQQEKLAHDEALKALNQVRIEVDRQYVSENLKMGDTLMWLGDKKQADTFYFTAFAYPWPIVPDEWDWAFRNMHMAGARGLVEARRHDLAALKSTYFTPTTAAEVGAKLQDAIKEAEKENAPK